MHNICLVFTIMQYSVIDESDWSRQDLGVDATSGTQAELSVGEGLACDTTFPGERTNLRTCLFLLLLNIAHRTYTE